MALALTDFVKAQPFSDFIPQRGSLILCKALYYCKVAPDVRGRRKGEWGMVIMKNIISLCAKFHIDREAWPGDPAVAWERIITAMSNVFQWSSNQRDWFLGSVNILWDSTYGARPCR